MIPVVNPFDDLEGYHCFGCATRNEKGLGMTFLFDEKNNELVSHWNPTVHLQGYYNVLHGGVQATLIDEMSSWAVYILLKTAGVTSRLEIRYRKPISIYDGPLTLRTNLVSFERKIAKLRTKLFNIRDEVCVEGLAQFFTYPPEVARKEYFYPGFEAFFKPGSIK